ncbi:type 2 DNA topoisomerase 6 subunit B-like [Amia ocellicauda]|uniref:type 2 DNA topoisomerase 6 subunit B-like n=1 Tax=Amia ocellicauda TaxID=2972642 RepID=UPI0034640CCB
MPLLEMAGHGVQQFLLRLSLLQPQVKIHYRLKLNNAILSSQTYGGKELSRFPLKGRSLLAESSPYLPCPSPSAPKVQCSKLHPMLGRMVSLLLPPDVVEAGLFGEVSLQPLAALCPCLRHFLNGTHVYVYGPSGLPVPSAGDGGPLPFLTALAPTIPWEEFGLQDVRFADGRQEEGPLCPDAIFTVGGERSPAVHQTLCLFLLVEHRDPFHSELADFIANEDLVEQQLNLLLHYNQEAVTSALHRLLSSALKGFFKGQKAQSRMKSALPVILGSISSIVASSTSLDFRTFCLDSMQVQDTPELLASLHRSLLKSTEDRFLPSPTCDNRESVSIAPLEAVHCSQGPQAPGETGTEEDEFAEMCAGLLDLDEEVISGPWHGGGSGEPEAGKRPWAGEAGSESPSTATCKQRRALFPLHDAQSRPSLPAPRLCPNSELDPLEEALWLQEVSNLSDWE